MNYLLRSFGAKFGTPLRYDWFNVRYIHGKKKTHQERANVGLKVI